MTRKRALMLGLGLVGAVLLLALGAMLLLVSVDLRPYIERYASASLDRRVSIGSFRIGWGERLTVALTDLRVANAEWGSAPEMIRIGALSAEIPLGSLLRGVLRFDKLDLEQPEILLERDRDGRGNWRFPGSASPPRPRGGGGSIALIPKNRSEFPTLIDMALQHGTLTYRRPGSRDLRLDFHALAIRSPADDQPVSLDLDGAYNGTPAKLTGRTQSFAVLRNPAIPFGMNFTLALAAARILFDGTMTAPLDFDGVAGKLRIEARELGDLLKIVGAPTVAAFPIEIAGDLVKQKEHWEIQKSQGTLATNIFTGTLALDEGGRGQPDNIGLSLAFSELDLSALTSPGDKGGDIDWRLDPEPGANFDATISAKRLAYGAIRVGDFSLRGRSKPGQVDIETISFTFGGGKVDAAGSAASVGDATRLNLRTGLSAIEAGEIARWLGVTPGQIAGPLSGRAILEMTGRNWQNALPHSRGQAVLAMSGGRVARALVEQASTDLRSLFRKGEGWLPINCLLGAVEIRDGIVALTPLRLRTPDTVVLGAGMIDLVHRTFDVTVATEGGPSLLALNLPIHIAGDFSHYRAQPVLGSGSGGLSGAGNGSWDRFAPELRDLLRRSACAS